jgi:hypothetical protein
VRLLQCPDASTPGAKASPLCAGLVDGKTCEDCGWDKKVPTCKAESEAPGSFNWRVVESQKTSSGHICNVVTRAKGSSDEFLRFIRSTYCKLAPHYFLRIWQQWAQGEIVRRMPTSHWSVVSDCSHPVGENRLRSKWSASTCDQPLVHVLDRAEGDIYAIDCALVCRWVVGRHAHSVGLMPCTKHSQEQDARLFLHCLKLTEADLARHRLRTGEVEPHLSPYLHSSRPVTD